MDVFCGCFDGMLLFYTWFFKFKPSKSHYVCFSYSFMQLVQDRDFFIHICMFICFTAKNSLLGNGYEEHKPVPENGVSKSQTERERDLPPPPPPRKNHIDSKEKPISAVARVDEDDIFVGDGVDYSIPSKDPNQSPLSEDMEESPRNKERVSYFAEPTYGPVPPSVPQEWQDMVSFKLLS